MITDEILAFNERFVENQEYLRFTASKFPDKKLAIISCMDTRLTELLPAALGLRNGDAKIIKNAGALVTHPYGSVMRSLLVCVYELGVETILVIGHDDCGMQNLQTETLVEKMEARGIQPGVLTGIRSAVDLDRWLSGFSSCEESVSQTVRAIRSHPLIPASVEVVGMIIDPETGRVRLNS